MSISRRSFVKGVAGTSAAATMGVHAQINNNGGDQQRPSSDQPLNLLLVFPDEMRAMAQGFKNEDPVVTPNIDRFAEQSRVMDQMVSNYPLCTPFRGMLMTGQYPVRSGITGNAHDYGALVGIGLTEYPRCWSDVLKDEGYSLGYIGKWHLEKPHAPFIESYNNPMEGRYWNEWIPPQNRHSFDYWYSYNTYDLHMHPMYWDNDADRDNPTYVNQWGPEHEADMAIKYLRNEGGKFRDEEKPFALVVSMNPPHSPYDQFPRKYLKFYEGETSKSLNTRPNVQWDTEYLEGYGPQYFKEYLAMITGVDEQFGRIIDELDKQGLSENTLVLFFSDHGCCIGSHGKPTKNNAFEESMRIPMLVRLPGKVKVGIDDALMSAPDIYPTILELLGFGDKIPGSVEGRSLATRMQTGEGESATSQPYYYIPYGETAFGRRGVRTKTHSLVIDRQDGQPLSYELYDNANDPYQMTNIAESSPDLVQKLIDEELVPWLDKTADSWRPAEFTTGTMKRAQQKIDACVNAEQQAAT